jgi:secondary thiamine-phosphate synthase enzyme
MIDLSTHIIELETQGHTHIIDITNKVQETLSKEGYEEGQVLIAAMGSTAGITTLEFEQGLVNFDVRNMLSKIAPYDAGYEHNRTWGDDNGAAHLRSTLIGTSCTFPFQQGKLILGTWQQIVFIDFDTRARHRQIVLQCMGRKRS